MQLGVMVNAFGCGQASLVSSHWTVSWLGDPQDRGFSVTESHPVLQLIDRLLLVPVPKLSHPTRCLTPLSPCCFCCLLFSSRIMSRARDSTICGNIMTGDECLRILLDETNVGHGIVKHDQSWRISSPTPGSILTASHKH